MRLFLTGFMGAGKSEVGSVVASKLGVPFLDLDREIELAAGATIAEIVARGGETELRRLESECLRATSRFDPAIIATGGGVVTREENRVWMRQHGRIAWLNAPFELLLDRLDPAARERRPLFRSESMARDLLESRIPFYRECDREISVCAGDSVDEVADRVLSGYREML